MSNKLDLNTINYLTKKNVYIEVLKFIFHPSNKKYRQLLDQLYIIYSGINTETLTVHQASVVSTITSLLVTLQDDEILHSNERSTIMLNIVSSNDGSNNILLETIENINKQIYDIEEIRKTIENVVDFVNMVRTVNDSYGDLENIIKKDVISKRDIINILKKVYSKVSNIILKHDKATQSAIFDISNIVSEIDKLREDKSNIYSIPTNIPIFDEYSLVTSGRLTLFASPTNHGKTTVMSSILADCATSVCKNYNLYKTISKIKQSKELTLCFISLEESDVDIKTRIIANMLDVNKKEVALLEPLTIELKSKQFLKHANSTNVKVFVKYFPAGTNTTEIDLLIQQLQEREQTPCLVVVDYMDKLSSSLINTDIYRLQLTSVSFELRNIATKYNVPVITATQLNRESITRARLDVDLLSESYGKSWEADSVVVFRQRQENNEPYIEVSIPKSRHTSRLTDPVLIPVDYSKNKVNSSGLIQTKLDVSESENQSKGQSMDYLYDITF